jgi:deoxyribonuclease IV
MKKFIIGAHCSITGGISKSIDRAIQMKANTMQIFTKSNRQWKCKPLDKKEVTLFKKKMKESEMQDVVVHASYLINIGSMSEELEKKSVDALTEELQRCEELEIKYLVLHPGAHLGNGVDECLKKISKNLDIVFEKVQGKSFICIENMAGQGTVGKEIT